MSADELLPGELLPGERLLWSGNPGRVRISLGDAGLSVYLLAALVMFAGLLPWAVRQMPRILVVGLVIAWGGGAVQAVAMLLYVLVIRPAIRRREAYQITSQRILVTSGLRRRYTESAYLDQIEEPSLSPRRRDVADVRLTVRPKSTFHRIFGDLRSFGDPVPAFEQPDVLVFRSVAAADNVRQVAAEARRRMLAGDTEAPPPGGSGSSIPLPDGVGLRQDERVLWTGRAGQVPWWFGLPDVSVSAFGVVWLVFVSVMGVLLATGSAGYLFLVPFAAFGAHLAAGRLVHRRMRIRRSTYVLTDRRLITAWRLREPTVVQADLVALLPPLARGVTVFTQPARSVVSRRGEGWKMLARPTATTGPPALVGITDPQAMRDLICVLSAYLSGHRSMINGNALS